MVVENPWWPFEGAAAIQYTSMRLKGKAEVWSPHLFALPRESGNPDFYVKC